MNRNFFKILLGVKNNLRNITNISFDLTFDDINFDDIK